MLNINAEYLANQISHRELETRIPHVTPITRVSYTQTPHHINMHP